MKAKITTFWAEEGKEFDLDGEIVEMKFHQQDGGGVLPARRGWTITVLSGSGLA